MSKQILLIIMLCVNFLISSQIESPNSNKNRDIIINAYEKNKEFFLILKNGEKYRVTEVISIDDNQYKFNILKNRVMGNIFYKNNISRRSSYKDNINNIPKVIIEVNADDILLVEPINYNKEFKEIRNYTFLIVGMYIILSTFF
tara:strand:+ start:1825 stop:2256 length:432 start_codon:yes stop_codon:yes gene_type:complete